jgi:hypothetical protein
MEMTLTLRQAYFTMFEFLKARYQRVPNDELGLILSSCQLLPDVTPADPAMWSDWEDAVHDVLKAEGNSDGYRGADFEWKK